MFGWAGQWTQGERERESPVWVCALLVEPDLGRAGQSHTVTLLENIDNKPFYILLLQLLSIIGQHSLSGLSTEESHEAGITKPPGYPQER